jgi:hypothetical protein
MRSLLTILSALLIVPAALGDKPDPSKSSVPVDIKLVAKKTTFKLPGDSKELKKQLDGAKESGRYPAPPVVDLVLEIRNRSDKDVQVWIGGDPVQTNFELKGPGAVTAKPNLAFTAIFIGPRPVKIEAGKSHAIPIAKLSGGFRGASEYSYWTEAGDYSLAASFVTGISPAPEGLKADESGFAKVTLKSEPIKIKVVEK